MNDVEQVRSLVREISPLLAGKPQQVQGAVLADLLSMWLAGHFEATNAAKTTILRNDVLDMHIDMVRKLIPESAKQIGLPW